MKINHITQSVSEAANPAQQAAIAVNMKRAHKKPKAVSEVSNKTLTSYQKKVSADTMKNNMDPTKRSPEKRNRSVAGVAKAHNRLEKRLGEGRDQDDKILRLFTSGKSPEAIAAQLSIDVDTVNDYINNRMPDSQDNSPRGYSSNRNVGQGMNEQFDPATKMMWIDQVSQLAQAVSQMSPEELVKLNDAFESFYRVAGGATAGATAVGLGNMFYSLLKDTLYAAKRKARVDTDEILQLKRQIISIHKTLKRVKSEKAVAKYQAMLKQAFEVLGELEARQSNRVAEGTESEQEELAKKIRELLAAGKDREANHLRHKLNNLRDRKRDKHNRHQSVAEGFGRDDDDYHLLDVGPTRWYRFKDGRFFTFNVYPGEEKQAERDGYSRTQAEARQKSDQGTDEQSVAEDSDPCWDNYKQVGMKKKNGRKVPNCVPKESSNYGDLDEAFNLEEEINKLDEKSAAWQKKSGKSKSGGLNQKGVNSYRREHPGSKLQTAVTTKPSKLKPGSKPAKRRKSFCARMSGMKGPMKDEHGKPTRKALALRKWNC